MPTLMATPDKHHPGILMTLAAHKTAQAANQPAQSGGTAPTDTPSTPSVTVSSTTNCRTGPSTDYDLLYTLNVGETAEVVGKYSSGNYWVINNPDGGGNCWLWGEYATISGDTDNLPEMIPPPAPVAKVHPKKPTPTSTAVPASDSNSGSSSDSNSNPSSNPDLLIPIPPNVIISLTSPPSAPSSLTVSTICNRNVFTLIARIDMLNWPAVSNATGYCIYKNGAQLICAPGHSYQSANLTLNTTIYGVAAYNSVVPRELQPPPLNVHNVGKHKRYSRLQGECNVIMKPGFQLKENAK